MSEKRQDYQALYSPEYRLASLRDYDDSWPIAESARYYQKQVSGIGLMDRERVKRLAYQIQLGLEAKNSLDYGEWTELPLDDGFKRLSKLAEEGHMAHGELVVGHLRLVAHIARLTMGWVPFGSSRLKQAPGFEDEEGELITKKRYESVFRGNIVRDLSIFKNSPTPLEERIQAGTEGLMRAATKYKLNSRSSFTNYAWWWIESTIIRGIAEDKIIRVPMNQVETLRKVRSIETRLSQELGRKPTADEAMEVTGWRSGMQFAVEASNAADVRSFETLDERIYDRTDLSQEELVEQIMREELADQALETLPDKERDILAMRFGFIGGEPMTLEEIGAQIGLTREGVRYLESQALARLATNRALSFY